MKMRHFLLPLTSWRTVPQPFPRRVLACSARERKTGVLRIGSELFSSGSRSITLEPVAAANQAISN